MASLNLTFDNITNADLLVGDASVVGDWNTFFDLPTYGTPFSAVTISGNTVQLFGGSGIKVKPGLTYNGSSNTYLISIIDSVGSITSVGGDAFTYCYGLTTVDLPACTIVYGYQDSPIANDYGGFGDCQNLINLSIPLLEEAGDFAFGGCYSLIGISFPLLFSGGNHAFQACTSLTTVDLPSLITAGSYCFNYCTSLTTVDLPSLITAEFNCFSSSNLLTTVNLPNLTTAGDYCFNGCTSLTTINIPSCTDLGGTVGDDNVFIGIIGNTITLTIPPVLMTCNSGSPDGDIQYLQANNTVTINVIDPNALNLVFDSIANADLLVGDASVVGDWNTFFDLPTYGTSFSAVTISGNTVQLFGGSNIELNYNNSTSGLFYSVTSLLYVYDKAGSIISLINEVFSDSGLLECEFPAVTYIAAPNDNGVFGYTSVTKIHAPNCSNFGAGAFEYCLYLVDLVVDFENTTSFNEDYVFYDCRGLPDSVVNQFTNLVTIFGRYCFNYCISLTTINLPNLTAAGQGCFSNCTALTSVNIPSCTDLGGTVGDDNVFFNIIGNTITLTIPAELMTCNSGNPDGDIQYLQLNNTVTIIEVIPPEPIPYSGIPANLYYEYTIGMLGDFSGGTAPSGATVPHPIMIGNDGLPYAQMNAVQIGGFGGLNN